MKELEVKGVRGPMWKREISDMLYKMGKQPANGKLKPIGERSLVTRGQVLYKAFRDIRGLGYKIDSVHQLKGRHIDALVESWVAGGISAGTIQNRLSILRVLCKWLGKGGMVQATEKYAEKYKPGRMKREVVAVRDKSWSAQGVDAEAVIRMAEEMDLYVAAQLRAIHAFGLRREESIQLKPHRADEGDVLRVRDGTKGGRERLVRVESEYQRGVLEMLKARCRRLDDSLGSPNRTLKQNIRRFNYVMDALGVTKGELGVTAHGLRHQRLNDTFEQVAGVPSPVRQISELDKKADEGQVEIIKGDPVLWDRARQRVSSDAGHARLSISSAYTGSARSVKKPRLDWTAGQEGRRTEAEDERSG